MAGECSGAMRHGELGRLQWNRSVMVHGIASLIISNTSFTNIYIIIIFLKMKNLLIFIFRYYKGTVLLKLLKLKKRL